MCRKSASSKIFVIVTPKKYWCPVPRQSLFWRDTKLGASIKSYGFKNPNNVQIYRFKNPNNAQIYTDPPTHPKIRTSTIKKKPLVLNFLNQ